MPLPIAPIIAGGASLLGQAIGGIFQGSANHQSREYAMEMYERQRADALADWNMQNEYNSPAAQMARYKSAGLNPNLIYGNMSNTPAVRSSSPESWRPEPIKSDLGAVAAQGIDAYYSSQIREGQVDMLKAQVLNAEEQRKLYGAQTLATLANANLLGTRNKRELQTIDISSLLLPGQLQAQELNNARTRAQTDFTLDENARREMMKGATLMESVQRTLKLMQDRATSFEQAKYIGQMRRVAMVDESLKQQDLMLKRKGIQPHDPLWQREVVDWLKSHKPFDPRGYSRDTTDHPGFDPRGY